MMSRDGRASYSTGSDGTKNILTLKPSRGKYVKLTVETTPPLENSCDRARNSVSGPSAELMSEEDMALMWKSFGARRRSSAMQQNQLAVPENYRKLSCSDDDVERMVAGMNVNPILDRMGNVTHNSSRNPSVSAQGAAT